MRWMTRRAVSAWPWDLVWSGKAVMTRRDGVPTLLIRVGNLKVEPGGYCPPRHSMPCNSYESSNEASKACR